MTPLFFFLAGFLVYALVITVRDLFAGDLPDFDD